MSSGMITLFATAPGSSAVLSRSVKAGARGSRNDTMTAAKNGGCKTGSASSMRSIALIFRFFMPARWGSLSHACCMKVKPPNGHVVCEVSNCGKLESARGHEHRTVACKCMQHGWCCTAIDAACAGAEHVDADSAPPVPAVPAQVPRVEPARRRRCRYMHTSGSHTITACHTCSQSADPRKSWCAQQLLPDTM